MDDGLVRVTSAGRNGVFDSLDADTDDIWSDMPTSPAEPFRLQRKWGWIPPPVFSRLDGALSVRGGVLVESAHPHRKDNNRTPLIEARPTPFEGRVLLKLNCEQDVAVASISP